MKRPVTTRAMTAALLAAGLSGCMTVDDYRASETERQEDMNILQEDLRKLSGRIEGVELETQQLRANFENLRDTSTRTAEDRIQSLEARIADLDARIRSVDSAREKDKQELIDKLSQKITQIVGSSSRSSSSAARQTKRSSSDTGYEHEVQSGESLSAIAAAYGVTVKAIMDNNDISDPNKLRAGQKLFIPQ